MRGLTYTVIAAVPVAIGLLRSRQWLAAQLGGRYGTLWCALGALGVGVIPALLVGRLVPDSASALKHHVVFAALAVPVLAGAVLLFRRGAVLTVPHVPAPAALAVAASEPEQETPTVAIQEVRPAAAVPGPGRGTARAAPLAAELEAPSPGREAEAETTRKASSRGPVRIPLGLQGAPPPPAPAAPPSRGAQRSSPAAAALRAVRAADEPEDSPQQSAATPTTVTECILTMSISCEECLLRNFQEMARAPLPEAQRETLTRLVEETDDKLARLRAARRRHHGEELVRVTWSQLPEVDLPVVSPGSSVAQIREKAMQQTEVMIGFYRTVATFAQRPSLKSLLATLALDGQRHLSVIEQSG